MLHKGPLSLAKLLCLLPFALKDCNNGQEKEKEETLMSGSTTKMLRLGNKLPMAYKTFQVFQIGHFEPF